jgi:hypothetical protein
MPAVLGAAFAADFAAGFFCAWATGPAASNAQARIASLMLE